MLAIHKQSKDIMKNSVIRITVYLMIITTLYKYYLCNTPTNNLYSDNKIYAAPISYQALILCTALS